MDGMFLNNPQFSFNLENWDVGGVVDQNGFRDMFRGATSFSANLCAWGPRVQTTPAPPGTSNMFLDSGCPVQTDPDLAISPPGPFCQTCVL